MLDIPISYLLSSYWYILSLRERSILKVRMKGYYFLLLETPDFLR
jgi:hypothetical protein